MQTCPHACAFAQHTGSICHVSTLFQCGAVHIQCRRHMSLKTWLSGWPPALQAAAILQPRMVFRCIGLSHIGSQRSRIPRDVDTRQAMLGSTERLDIHRELTMLLHCSCFPIISKLWEIFPNPCSKYIALFFLGHVFGLPKQRAVSFDPEFDLKRQDETYFWGFCIFLGKMLLVQTDVNLEDLSTMQAAFLTLLFFHCHSIPGRTALYYHWAPTPEHVGGDTGSNSTPVLSCTPGEWVCMDSSLSMACASKEIKYVQSWRAMMFFCPLLVMKHASPGDEWLVFCLSNPWRNLLL